MAEVTLATAEQYFLDRVQELRNRVDDGNPFVFLGAFALVNTLQNVVRRPPPYLAEKFGYSPELMAAIHMTSMRMMTGFTLIPQAPQQQQYQKAPGRQLKLNLSHNPLEHLKEEETDKYKVVTLEAVSFLNKLQSVILDVFSDVEDNPLLGAQTYVNINDGNQFIGYGN